MRKIIVANSIQKNGSYALDFFIACKGFISLFLLMVLISLNLCSQETKAITSLQRDSTAYSLEVGGQILLTNIGFAPLPAFSFDDPIVIASLSIKKRKFSYEPAFSLGLNGKPWMFDNWFSYIFIDKKKVSLSAALNPSLFFKIENEDTEKETIIAQRNLCLDLSIGYMVSKKVFTVASYQYVHGFDRGTPSGQILFLKGFISKLSVSKMIFIDINPQVFCFDFTGNNDGVFGAVNLNIGYQQLPLKLFFQSVQQFWSNFDGPHFKWSFGLMYQFRNMK